MKKILEIVFTVLLFLGFGSSAMAADYIIQVNGETLNTEVRIVDGRSLIPLRAVGEALGLEITYDAATAVVQLHATQNDFSNADIWLNSRDGSYAANIVSKKEANKKYNMTIDKSEGYKTTVAPTNIDGRIYVPVRVVCDSFGAPVSIEENRILVSGLFSDTNESKTKVSKLISKAQNITNNSTSTTSAQNKKETTGQKNAVKKAKSYLEYSAFSYEGLIEQLEFEKFTHEEAVYGVSQCNVDWNAQALKKAKSYLEYSAFSYKGLLNQLKFEKFTDEQAAYGVNSCGANWKEQAVKKAKSYLEYSGFSREGLIGQLEFEGFTHEQAVYGVESNGY